jgi:hypothetical protein
MRLVAGTEEDLGSEEELGDLLPVLKAGADE